jgi:hypothetical protein
MEELIKKYATLLIMGLFLSRILTAIILLAAPNLLTFELPDGGTSTLSTSYLSSGLEYLINVGFVILLSKDLKKENINSNLMLMITLFSSFIGVVFFLLIIAFKEHNHPKIEVNE